VSYFKAKIYKRCGRNLRPLPHSPARTLIRVVVVVAAVAMILIVMGKGISASPPQPELTGQIFIVTKGDESIKLAQLLDAMIRGDAVLDDRLQAINRPTLVLWGRDDKLIPLNFGERFHQEIANSRFRIIDNCGHMPQVERPDEFANAVLQFLSDAK